MALRLSLVLLIPALVINTGKAQDSTQDNVPSVQKLDMKAGMHPPKATHQPEAEYSPEARKKQIDGKCLISMVVDTSGMPRNVHVIRCSDQLFAQPSLASTTQYRFRPATMANGDPVAVEILVEVDFRIDGAREVADPINFGIGSPPGIKSTEPDAEGVYPLAKPLAAPTIKQYPDQSYGKMAFAMEGKSPCDIVLTIDTKGKPSNPSVIKCGPENLQASAMKSIMAARFKPAELQGKPVPVRAMVHLEYGEFQPSASR
jgi:outer membrane biosynthesis protein TonB